MQKILARCTYCFFLIVIVLCFSMIFLTGCQSTDKNESYLDTSGMEYTKFEYDVTTNKTKVIWATTLTNNTIYNFDSFSVRFKLYHDDTLINIETYDYSRCVKHGKDYTGAFNFYADNEINAVEYVSWTAHYTSFWETYKIWFIIMIVITSVASVIYIIVMIVQDLELSDTFDAIVEFFEDHGWVAVCFLIPLAGTVWGIVTSYWVPILIVLGGIIALILLALISHLIKFIVECIFDNIGFSGGIGRSYADYDDEESFDPTYEDVSDYIDDRDALMLFGVEQLKNYCRENGIRGFSSLNKSALVDLISDSQESAVTELKPKSSKKVVMKSNVIKKKI